MNYLKKHIFVIVSIVASSVYTTFLQGVNPLPYPVAQGFSLPASIDEFESTLKAVADIRQGKVDDYIPNHTQQSFYALAAQNRDSDSVINPFNALSALERGRITRQPHLSAQQTLQWWKMYTSDDVLHIGDKLLFKRYSWINPLIAGTTLGLMSKWFFATDENKIMSAIFASLFCIKSAAALSCNFTVDRNISI